MTDCVLLDHVLSADFVPLSQAEVRGLRFAVPKAVVRDDLSDAVAVAGYDAMLLPTVPDAAPTIAEVARDDASYFCWNARMLRCPSLVNLFDGCALSIPCHAPGQAPVGLTIAGTRNADRRILAIGQAIQSMAPSPQDADLPTTVPACSP